MLVITWVVEYMAFMSSAKHETKAIYETDECNKTIMPWETKQDVHFLQVQMPSLLSRSVQGPMTCQYTWSIWGRHKYQGSMTSPGTWWSLSYFVNWLHNWTRDCGKLGCGVIITHLTLERERCKCESRELIWYILDLHFECWILLEY